MAWVVIRTRPNAHALAGRHLRQQGFEYYNPRIKQRVRAGRYGMTWRRMQLFKDYMFVQIIDQWHALKSTLGVSYLLMSEAERPAVINSKLIEELKKMESKNGLINLGVKKFSLGQKVQIKSGPFAFENGLYDGQRDDERVFVLLSILGSKRRVEIKETNLLAI